jgi:leader peptidase (prepilin peptidase)/N-methyltransferase
VSSAILAAAGGAAVGLLASPYLARLTVTVPDREDRAWWRGKPPGRARLIGTVSSAVVLAGLGGGAAGITALWPALVVAALLAAPLVVIDYEHHRLPDRLTLPLAAAAVLLLLIPAAVHPDWHAYLHAIGGGAAVFAVLFAMWFISPRSFGFGDVKLGGGMGVLLGWFGWLAVYLGIFAGFVLGALVSMVMLASRNATLKSHVAFGPMLILGPYLVMVTR